MNKVNRDVNGWRIPRAGTKSRIIYEMHLAGYTRKQTMDALPGTSRQSIGVLLWKIKHPEDANARST